MGNNSLLLKIAIPVIGLLLGGIVIIAGLFLLKSWWSLPPAILGFSQGPEQPIAFPHTVHVQQAGIDCQFCHRTVSTDETAGIPAVQQCLFCHDFQRIDGSMSDRPAAQVEIAKLRTAFYGDDTSDPQPINWVRVHRLPDSVQFLHSPHIQAGFTCSTCHSDVASMEKVKQVRNLKMRDCVDCHRQNNAPTDCATCHY
jgi:hypothetical protein